MSVSCTDIRRVRGALEKAGRRAMSLRGVSGHGGRLLPTFVDEALHYLAVGFIPSSEYLNQWLERCPHDPVLKTTMGHISSERRGVRIDLKTDYIPAGRGMSVTNSIAAVHDPWMCHVRQYVANVTRHAFRRDSDSPGKVYRDGVSCAMAEAENL